MKRFYRLDDDEEGESSDDDEEGGNSDDEEYKTVEQLEKELEEDEGNLDDEDDEDDSGDEGDHEEFKFVDRMRGEGVSSSESEDEEDEEEEEEEEEEVCWRKYNLSYSCKPICSYNCFCRSQLVMRLVALHWLIWTGIKSRLLIFSRY
jgi:hypothetical protein